MLAGRFRTQDEERRAWMLSDRTHRETEAWKRRVRPREKRLHDLLGFLAQTAAVMNVAVKGWPELAGPAPGVPYSEPSR
jgi:hypothetical protein